MAESERRVTFQGTGGALFGIVLLNLLLSILTLGVYAFWGRTRVRRFTWGQTEFEGDRFAYHGTGVELLVGWLKASGIFLGLFLVIAVVQTVLGQLGQIVAPLLFWGAVLTLTPLIMIGARRYRMSRTSWRGVRFSFRGPAREFMGDYIVGAILTGMTLGIYAPHLHNTIRAFFTEHSYFGSQHFEYDGDAKDIFRTYAICWLLALPTLGLSMMWYRAARERYQWSRTTFAAGRFDCTLTGGGLLGLALTNALLVVFTLGIGAPWAMVRQHRYFYDHLSLTGEVDLAAIRQDKQTAGTAAEGLADALDIGGGFDIGL